MYEKHYQVRNCSSPDLTGTYLTLSEPTWPYWNLFYLIKSFSSSQPIDLISLKPTWPYCKLQYLSLPQCTWTYFTLPDLTWTYMTLFYLTWP